MSYTFFKAQGHEIGKSLVDNSKLDLALEFIEKAKKLGKKFLIPVDIVVADDFSANANTQIVDVDGIPADWEGIDIGPKTREIYADVIKNSKLVVWNGPMGVFEIEPFSHGTRAVAQACAETQATRLSAAAILRQRLRSSIWLTKWTISPQAAALP